MRVGFSDEIWQFVGTKAKNATLEQKAAGWGDAWTWVAIDAETKLIISYLVGGRDTEWASDFAWDLQCRVIGRPQITTDAHKLYLKAIEGAFGQAQRQNLDEFKPHDTIPNLAIKINLDGRMVPIYLPDDLGVAFQPPRGGDLDASGVPTADCL